MNDSHKCEFLIRKIILEILLPYLTKFQDKNILGCDELKLSCLKLLLSSLQIALNFFVNLPSSCWLRKLCYGSKLCRTMCYKIPLKDLLHYMEPQSSLMLEILGN
uniref:Uncharacterized protein n=2 Tax=Amphimedon queenslandica TaxID=400682 RepID=A0A1X7U7B4_AMPQE